jgi:hypothetical protein
VINDVFAFQQNGMSESGKVIGEWIMSKKVPTFIKKFHKRMIKLPDGFFGEEVK